MQIMSGIQNKQNNEIYKKKKLKGRWRYVFTVRVIAMQCF